ncbi:MAG TPA: HPr(Ser) kinase/phosphatase [bacterium]|nr:HPr(Ser) kinase/phosphatase [bacterium]HOY43266.1 HPr(Ser) kinase/phosphatase [bacterium]HPG82432.1 HPr(Ser) kinase/phosphatase [bacterium]HPM59745.1 HPr(Ser) kinase/phosphatase [bacterium]
MTEQIEKPFITVEELYQKSQQRVALSILNNTASFSRKIRERELHRPGLAMSGFVDVFTFWRVQIMGNTEIGYLTTLPPDERRRSLETVLGFELPCVIITNNHTPPGELLEVANKHGITLFSTPLDTTTVTHHLSEYLETVFAEKTIIHGALVDVYGVGMLITGEPAVGKSELALDLIERGHQLVADDVVQITRLGMNRLEGAPTGRIKHYMEIRGLGIINIRSMFGIRAIRGKKVISVVVHLEKFTEDRDYERIGIDGKFREILGVQVPLVELPILPGKNITVIAEVIATNQKMRDLGENSAEDFNKNLINAMKDQENG